MSNQRNEDIQETTEYLAAWLYNSLVVSIGQLKDKELYKNLDPHERRLFRALWKEYLRWEADLNNGN